MIMRMTISQPEPRRIHARQFPFCRCTLGPMAAGDQLDRHGSWLASGRRKDVGLSPLPLPFKPNFRKNTLSLHGILIDAISVSSP